MEQSFWQSACCGVQESKEAEAFQTAARSSAEKDRKLKHLLISAKGNENALKFFDLQEQDVPALFIQNEDDQKFVKKNVGPSELASFISEFQVQHSLDQCMLQCISSHQLLVADFA